MEPHARGDREDRSRAGVIDVDGGHQNIARHKSLRQE